MVRRNITLYIEDDLIRSCKLKDINISKSVESALKVILNMEIAKEPENKTLDAMKKDAIELKKMLTDKMINIKESEEVIRKEKEKEEKSIIKRIIIED